MRFRSWGLALSWLLVEACAKEHDYRRGPARDDPESSSLDPTHSDEASESDETRDTQGSPASERLPFEESSASAGPELAEDAGGATTGLGISSAGPTPMSGSASGATSTAWVPFQTDDARTRLDGVLQVIVGQWHGIVSTPWFPRQQFEADIEFRADGRYVSRCTADPKCLAFCYGTPDDTELKRYRIDATLRSVFGEIDVPFGSRGDYYLPRWQGLLNQIERDAAGQRLRFEFTAGSDGQIVRYELTKSGT